MTLQKKVWLTLVFLSALPHTLLRAQLDSASVRSPNGQLVIEVATLRNGSPSSEGGQLAYRVLFRGKEVVSWSDLGLQLLGQPTLGAEVKIAAVQPYNVQETYRMPHGKNNPVTNVCQGLRVSLQEPARMQRQLEIELRAYDEAVAFRYHVPNQPSLEAFELEDEITSFRLPSDGFAYPLYLRGFRTSYEENYVELPLTGIDTNRLIGLPFLFELPGRGWVAITEAHLENYAGMYLVRRSGRNPVFAVTLPPNPQVPTLKVLYRLPHSTPWRVIFVGDNPGKFIESDVVINLNPPTALEDTTWVRPGKAAWPWWSGRVVSGVNFAGGMNNETMKYYIDFAARAGLEYLLIDAGWYGDPGSPSADITRMIPEINVPELVQYANSKGVKVWLWVHWSSVNRQMDEAFPLYEKWGVVGVKVDFMNRDDQWMVDFYHRVVRKAAQHHLMVDFHGAYKPTGMRRTYPNLMTREGVLGLEYSKWSARVNPDHNTYLPFTRMLAGPMDYTPGGFDNVRPEDFIARGVDPMVLGTRVHQLALFVLFESPFQMVSDHPSAYENHPAVEFIRKVPASWEQTVFLDGKPGDYVVLARRSGKKWFLGGITDWNPRAIELPLGFLEAGKYQLELYRDGDNAAQDPKQVAIEKRVVTRQDRLSLRMVSGGGFAAVLSPQQQ